MLHKNNFSQNKLIIVIITNFIEGLGRNYNSSNNVNTFIQIKYEWEKIPW